MQDPVVAPCPIHRSLSGVVSSLFCALLVFSLPVRAVVCKTVTEDGVVSYTDTPRNKCANPVKLPDYSRYAPRPLVNPSPAAGNGTPPATAFSGYTRLAIAASANDGTVRSNEGKVPVRVTLEPPLQPDHKVVFILDGQAAGPATASVAAMLTGVTRGTHSLSVQVQDRNGAVLRAAGPIRFTLRKEALPPAQGSSGSTGAYDPAYEPAKDQRKSFESKPPGQGHLR